MKYQDYAFTLRKTSIRRKKATEAAYADHIKRIFSDNGLKVYDYGFENEGGLHCHGIVQLQDPYIKTQRRLRVRGWRLHLTILFDMKGWISYYNKNKNVQMTLLCPSIKDEPYSDEYIPDEDDLEEFQKYRDEFLPVITSNLFNSGQC